MRSLYPAIEPDFSDYLSSGGHRIYYEQCGDPCGIPVVFLHGGPGSGCRPDHRRFFDPARYRIILVDQRGAGRSLPHGELRDNTTQFLVADLEAIRRQLEIDRWLLFGGSWGATLALVYALHHPERVLGMILRGCFLARQRDLQWFLDTGAPRIYPEQWSRLIDGIPPTERADLVAAIDRRLRGEDELEQRRMAREWTLWGNRVALADAYDAQAYDGHVPITLLNRTRIELHYARNGYFLEEGRILRDCRGRIGDLPIMLIHGRRDLVCPVEAAYSLQQALPHSDLRVLENAGHLALGEPMIDALVEATDRMLSRLSSLTG